VLWKDESGTGQRKVPPEVSDVVLGVVSDSLKFGILVKYPNFFGMLSKNCE